MSYTSFGAITSTSLNLIQAKVEVSPAQPKTSYAEIPGANGAKDLTEALGVGVKYNDREIAWTFALYPGADWYAKQAEVSNAINGKACNITLSDDPSWYYVGRVSVESHKSDRLLRTITVKAICRPYKRKQTESTVSRTDLSTSYKNCVCNIGAMPLIPTITVGQETMIKWGTNVTTVSSGTHVIPALLMSGSQTIQAKMTSGSSGTISIVWREGSL